MARVNNQRQKNKKFKAKSKGAVDRKKSKASTKTKAIVKPKGRVKNTRSKLLNQVKQKKKAEIEKINAKNQYLDVTTKSRVIQQLKNEPEVKIVVLVKCNKDANPNNLLSDIYNSLKESADLQTKTDFQGIPFPVLQIIPKKKTFIKNKLILISGQKISNVPSKPSQNLQSLMDMIKLADIICPVLSCKSTDLQQMNLQPHEKGGAFDEMGYLLVNMIRSIGTPTTIGIVQDLGLFQIKHHDKIENLFKRFIYSELGENDKINYIKGNQQQVNKLLRQIDSTTPVEQPWKTQRGYMLVENATIDEKSGNVTFHGFLKGNSIFPNQLVHATGFDDYQIQKIEIKGRRKHKQGQMSEQDKNLTQHSTNPQPLFPFSKQQQISQDILSGLNKLQVSQKKQQQQMGEQQQQQQQFQDQSDVQQQQEQELGQFQNNKQEEKTKRIEMQMRKEDELEFQDQVQYAAEEVLRDKFKDYQGLKNFKSGQWNQLENLPDQYDRIYVFKHYQRTLLTVINEHQNKSFAYPNMYVSVTLKNFPKQKISQYCSIYPMILTFLHKHQRKMTQIHLKVRRNPYYPKNQSIVESNQQFAISLGFRRFVTRPIFSKVISGTQKTKFIKKIGQDYQSYFYCSFYYYNYFPPAPVLIHRVNQFSVSEMQLSPIMYGTLAKCDPLHIILQRIVLTGYPFKINKRRSTVRFMFFNPKDVKYFKPIEVRTKMGLKGRIEESLGMHGYMKVLFNDKIKHNDTVCMSLYRRVFPEPNF